MSDKALFYAEDLKAGSAICLDDVSLSEQMQETLKGVTTSFKKPFIYRTVNKDRKGQTCIIPERCVWWVAKMEGTGDDQVWNRMLTCWIDDNKEQDNKVLARELSAAAALPLTIMRSVPRCPSVITSGINSSRCMLSFRLKNESGLLHQQTGEIRGCSSTSSSR